ncbi:Galactose oxidase, central domain [Streptomyces sp. DvalAA-14]|uniref:carboxypeptidase regulatory-like domain-containing protein n=1 Tax=unclassified Streptomyces TaxID=2593676 RepID=UPI00081B95A4|nr:MULTISPECIES: carboxypeptidase regulatory-like domain-containing protein [unclassified Streptomyces]MYS24771.1 galactose oxidase [Streptomyces sp. SID4948]SCE49215.1 Galactose oxidase, central domain [Streptomyces sp. DvalAA-14]
MHAIPPPAPRSTGSAPGRVAARSAAATALVALLALLAVLLPQSAAAGTGTAHAAKTGGVAAEPLCGAPKPGAFTCFSFRRTDVRMALGLQRAGAASAPDGLSPADLRSAYDLPADGGAGATIAIVDAYDAPTAEADLAVYRQQFGLPACTAESGCFRKVDQRGGADYPQPDDGWAGEISLDLDMVSAVAPDAKILLVEADDTAMDSLGGAVNTAVALGAEYVSNSYGAYTDDPGQPAADEAYFDHPGTAVVFSSGDDGYGISYPASSPYVTSVGGTSLRRDDSSRGWSESVWNTVVTHSDGTQTWGAPGSGCSAVEAKPAFQTDAGCAGRTVADVSAVADPETGVAVYNSFSDGGWNVYGGTSASAPIITGTYALAGRPVAGTFPNSYPYQTPSALNDVTTGDNASCPDSSLCGFGSTPDCDPAYLCAARTGYDAPTGLGTPDGPAAFRPGPHADVHGTVTDAATGRPVAGAAVDVGDYHATSAGDGTYRLDIPAGSYPAKAGAFGYAQQDLGTLELPDGTDLVKDIALQAVPSQSISGTVQDTGHAWGVYARITLDGVPGETYSDPATGAYTISVPMNRDYTLHAAPLAAGYQPVTRTVSVADRPLTGVDLVPALNDHGALPAGYAIGYHGGEQQHFDAPAAPAGWTVRNNTPAGGWQFDDTLNRGNQTGGSGHFASVDDFALGWAPVDTELISPVYDFSAEKTPQLDFETALPSLYRLDSAVADVDVSTDGGTDWTTVWHHEDVLTGPSHQSVPLDAYAGKSSVRVRFHYTGSLTGIWQVDDVAIGTRGLRTLPGGLLVGHVTDANTGAGVPGATVTSAAAPADTTRAVVSPGDPAVTDGVYWLFSGLTGKRSFTAGLDAFGYPSVTAKVDVAANKATAADFALHPARLSAAESSVSASVAWGNSKTVDVRLTNTGGSPVTFSLGERDLGPAATPPAAAPGISAPTVITPDTAAPPAGARAAAKPAAKTQATRGSTTGADARAVTAPRSAATTADQAWQPLTDLPTAVSGGLTAVNDGVLYTGLGATADGNWTRDFASYDQAGGRWTPLASPVTKRFAPAYGFIRGKLYVVGGRDEAGNGIRGGEVYDPATDTWSQIADAPLGYGASGGGVVGDKLYVIGGCTIAIGCGTTDVQVYDPATDSWSAGKPYPEPVSFPACGTVEGALTCAGGAYEPVDGAAQDTADTFRLDAATGVWQRVADAPTDFWGAAGTAAGGRLLVAGGAQVTSGTVSGSSYAYDPGSDTWSALPGLPQPLMLAQAAAGWYVTGGETADGATTATALKLPGWDAPHADVPWLSETSPSLTVKGGKSVTVKVTLDATAMGAADYGDHRAAIVVDSDTPYASVTVPVTLSVTAPAGWGQLSGTVTGLAPGGAVPLPGAVVEVDSKNGGTTSTTDAQGGYRLWRPVSDGPLTVIVAADGYRPATRTVKLVKAGTVTADFALAAR